MNDTFAPPDLRPASALKSLRHVFVRDLTLDAMLGVHDHEKLAPQRIVVNLDLGVYESGGILADDLGEVVCYETLVKKVEAIVSHGHVNLVESLAEMIAQACLADGRVMSVRVRVEKPDAIANAASVGVEIERVR